MIEIVFGLIVGWGLGIATVVLWPRGNPLPPLGGVPRVRGGGYQPLPGVEPSFYPAPPPRVPTNPPQGTGAIAPKVAEKVNFHFHGHPDDFDEFPERLKFWLEEAHRSHQEGPTNAR